MSYRRTTPFLGRAPQFGGRQMWGGPGAPWIKLKAQDRVPHHIRSSDLVVEHKCTTPHGSRLLHYLGKHVPHPQKSLWSPDTPVMQDRHLFKLTSIDIDAFKYWFGVKRALVDKKAWPVLWQAGLLPPPFKDDDPLVPKPIYDKQELYRYYLKHRRSDHRQDQREEYLNYHNSMVKGEEERAMERPVFPWT